MKWNWGIAIAIFYGLFMIWLISFLFFSTTVDWDLVDDDYYEKELKYQEQIDKKDRAARLGEKLLVKSSPEKIELKFPHSNEEGGISGKIYFFRPSDSKLDRFVDIETDSLGIQTIPAGGLKKGLWMIKVDWQVGDSTYFFEDDLIIY